MKAELFAPKSNKIIRQNTYLYVVETDRKNPSHHGLHTNMSPHVLTKRPGPGDRIVATIDMDICRTPDGIRVQASLMQVGFKLLTHAGRSPLLGEDGLEDAFGNDALSLYVPEILDGASWNYAPCIYEPDPEMPERDTVCWRFWNLTKERRWIESRNEGDGA